jgi:hypothetical protein
MRPDPGGLLRSPRHTAPLSKGTGQGRLLLIPSPGSNNEALVVKLAERFGPELPPSRPDPAILEALAALAQEYGVESSIPSG